MKVDFKLTVTDRQAGQRLDRFIRDAAPQIQGRSIRFALESGDVSLDGHLAVKGIFVQAGQVVIVRRLAERADWLAVPGDLPGASVVYHDASVAILDKPEGIQTEPLGVLEPCTLAGYFRWRFPETLPWVDSTGSPLLSRLDCDTSGVVLAALTEPAFRFLSIERQAGRISKRYVCKVAGHLPEPTIFKATIDSRGGRCVKVRSGIPDPQPVYWTRVDPLSFDGASTLIAAEIVKGKRHQIRAHLAASGHPILGDTVYGRGGEGRLMLHAAEVTFIHPDRGERMAVASPIPAAFGVQRLPCSSDSSWRNLSRSPGNSD